MFSLNKRFMAALLIIAMTSTNVGTSTLAVSISHYVEKFNENAKDDSDIAHRYYDEWRLSFESKTYLMNDEVDETEEGQASDGAEKTDAAEESTDIRETDASDFDVENESETNGIEEGSHSSPVQGDDEGPEEESGESRMDDDGELEDNNRRGEQCEPQDETRRGELSEPEVASISDADDDLDNSTENNINEEPEDETEAAEQSESDENERRGEQCEPGVTSASEANEEESSEQSEPDVASSSDASEEGMGELCEPDVASLSELAPREKLNLYGADPHEHKICGATAGGSCLHTLGDMHDASFDYTYQPFFDGATMTEEEIKNKLQDAADKYYLDEDISFTTLTSLTVTNPLYLCLNGHNLLNAYFRDGSFTGTKIYITNCTNTVSRMRNTSDINHLFFYNAYVYGMNGNIKFESDLIANTIPNGEVFVYDCELTSPDSTVAKNNNTFTMDDNAKLTLENIFGREFAQMKSFLDLVEKQNVNVTLKNVTIDNIKTDTSIFYFVDSSYRNSVLNLYGVNRILNSEVGLNPVNTDKTEAVITLKGTDMIIHEGVTSIVTCVSKGRSIIYESQHDTANIEIKYGAALEVDLNQIEMQNDITCAMYVNNRFRLFGNLNVINNTVINCGTTNPTVVAGLCYMYTGGEMTIGNSEILVENNTSDGDETLYPKQHMYQFYSAKTDGVLVQEAGTEMRVSSRMKFAFINDTAGTIMNSWTHSNAMAFENIFTADKFADEDFIVVKDTSNRVGIMSHGHKICGYSSLEECDHRGIASHSEIFSYSKFFGNSTMTDADIEAKLNAGGSYRLDKDINLTSLTQIRLTADLYLCLNGKSMHNVVFASGSNNGFKIYITNCKNEASTISRGGDSAEFVVNYSNVSVIAPYKNITLDVATRFLYNVTTTAAKFDLYGLTFVPSTSWPLSNSLVRSNSAGSEANVSNVNISNFETNGDFAIVHMLGSAGNKSALNIYESKLEGNTHSGGYTETKSIVYANHCDVKIYDTDIVNNDGGIAFCNNGSGTSDLKNVNMTGNTGICWIVNLNRTINDFDNVNISNNYWCSGHGGAVVDVKNNAILNVKSGGLKINKNIQILETTTCLYLAAGGKLNVEEGATVEIRENKLKYYTSSYHDVFTIFPGAMDPNYEISILGNLYIEDNKIVGATTPGTRPFAAVYLPNNRTMTVGNGTIKVQNNFIYSDADGTVRADETTSQYYHMYQVLTANTNGMFTQAAVTEMSTDSRMEVAVSYSPYMGVIFDSWAHSDKDAFKKIFSADKYRDDEFSVVKDENNKLRIMAHGHKICGHASDEDCNHRGIATHSEVFSYAAFFGSTTMTDTQKVNKLRAGGSYRLDADLELSGPTNVALNADLYLCLNGKTLNNVVFDSSGINNHKVYITNCKKETATIRRETGAAWFITNYKDASVMAPHKNINLINSNRMRNETTTANKLDLYGVTFSQDPKGDIEHSLIRTVAPGSEINISNVNLSNFIANANNFAYIQVGGSGTNKSTLNIYDSVFSDNEYKGSYDTAKNIVNVNNCNTSIYDTLFKNNSCSTVFANNNSGSSILQNVEFIDNTTFAQVVKLHGTTNDFDNVNVSNNLRAVSQEASAIDVANNAILNVKSGGLKVNKNTQVIGAVDCIWLGDDGVLNVEEGATLEIKENIFTHTSISTAVPAYSMILGNNSGSERWEINILGNLYVENNKLVNAPNPMNVVFAGLYVKDGKRITTGNGVVKVQNNGVYTDADGKVKADEKVLADYHPYQVLADNVNGFLAQAAGTEISIDSRMEVAFINSPYIGIIYDSWTHSNKNAYETIFTADRFRDEDLKVVKDENNKIRIMTHAHKICGAASDESCLHTLVASHSEVYDFFPVFAGSTLTDAEILAKLNTPGKYKLDGDINLTNPIEVDLGADLYICLNGHSITNVRFKSTGGFTAYITNCKAAKSTFDSGSDQVLSTSNAEIYGINKNITFKTASVYNAGTTTSHFYTYSVDFTHNGQSFNDSILSSSANKTIYCEDTKFSDYELTPSDTGESMFYFMVRDDAQVNSVAKFKNITVSNIRNLNSRLMSASPSAEVHWYGTNVIEKNIYKVRTGREYTGIYVKGLFKVSDGTLTIQNNETGNNSRDFMMIDTGVLEVDEDATLVIQQNKKVFSQYAANSFLKITSSGSKVHGTLKVLNNSITNISSGIAVYLSAMQIDDGVTVELGDNPIIIQGNTCDGNVATSPYQHMYQVLSHNGNGFLTQKAGTEMSKDSRMQVQFATDPFTGVIANNWSHSDSAAYDTIFSADRTRGTELAVNLNMNKQVEIVNGGHLHKPCGVEKVTYCSHRGIDDHNYGVPYLPFSNGIDMTNDTAIRNKLAAGGYYYADQNIAASAIQEVTLAADLYICLNGKNMANISFGNSQYKVYITNCSSSEVSITVASSSEFLKTVSANLVAGRGRINVIADGFYYANRNSTITINSTFYNICSSPGSTAASEQQLFSMQNYTSRGHSIVVSNCEFKNHRKQYGSGVRPNMLFMRTKGRIYDTTFKNLTTGNSAFLTYEDSDILYDNCTFDTISTGGTESGVGSLFRSDMWSLEGVGEDIPSTLTLENITILNSEMNRSFVEVNSGSRLTININNSFVAKNNDVNRTGGNNFFNTKILNLTDAKLELKNNTSNNTGLAGLVLAQNSIKLYNSHIDISNNTIKRNNTGAQALLKLNSGDILIASNSYIVIKDNKINTDGVTGNNANLSALYLDAGQTISIEGGTSYIDISGNVPIGANKDLAGNHMYQLYMTTADLFKIQNNGLLDMSKSYAEFALPEGTPTGTLFNTWNATKVKNWNADAHKGRFTASNFGAARKNLVVTHYKHELIITEKEKFIDSDRAYIDAQGDPLVPTISEALRYDTETPPNPFIWWYPTEIRDAYGNVVNFSPEEEFRSIREWTKWSSAADNKTRTAWGFKPIYATEYTIRLRGNGFGTTRDDRDVVAFTVRRGTGVSINNEFRKPYSINYKFLNYNTNPNDTGKKFTTGYYSQGIVADDRTAIDLYVIYLSKGSGGGTGGNGGGGGGGGGGELQQKSGDDYQYVTQIYETHTHIADVTALNVTWQKYANTYVAYAIYQYASTGTPISYALLKDGFYLIHTNNVNHVYGFDKAGNMLTGYVEAGGHRYIMAPDGDYEGSMLKSTANVFGNSYLFTDDGIMNDSNTYSSNQFVYDMEIGRYKYVKNLPDGRNPNYVKNELKDINYRGKTAKYLFNGDGLMMTGLTGYQNNIYYFNEYGPYIGSAFTGVVYAGGGQATFNDEGHLLHIDNE